MDADTPLISNLHIEMLFASQVFRHFNEKNSKEDEIGEIETLVVGEVEKRRCVLFDDLTSGITNRTKTTE